jgi:ATP-dependent RNA helicase DDX54/DBP10
MTLNNVQYVVFDEADRLLEMGFSEQIAEITKTLNDNRQTLLFSATLPGVLAEFVKAGLNDPKFIRLDTEAQLSEDLHMAFFSIRGYEKEALLLHLLREVIPERESTVVFVSTRHHVEYIHSLLDKASISNVVVYGNMDQDARSHSIAEFRKKYVNVMVVTDVAARGIGKEFQKLLT